MKGHLYIGRVFVAAYIAFLGACAVTARTVDVAKVEGGTFTPLYGVYDPLGSIYVKPFLMDRHPVTNQEFFDFTQSRPEWAPGSPPLILSDQGYLKHWKPQSERTSRPRSEDGSKPVVHVSWFSASEYCAHQGGRLPTVLEWEYAAAANERVRDATRDPAFVQQLLQWYSVPTGGADNLSQVGQRAPNLWGIHDLHGLVWEWTADFNSVFVVGDNRRDGEALADLFCGAGAPAGADKANYAAFMRYALRNSLKGNYTTSNLGFRCVYEMINTHIRSKP